jgi:hypothetical protein
VGFRRRIRHLHSLGPRPAGECIAAIVAACPDARAIVEDQLDRLAEMDPVFVRCLGADDWIEPAGVLRLVAGGRQ